MKEINVAIIGATGVVGMQMLKVLSQRSICIKNLYLFASGSSAGNKVKFNKEHYIVEELTTSSFNDKKIDYALFCTSNDISEKYVPLAASLGIVCIDNSSHFRNDPKIPLVVPEVNSHDLKGHNNIIANPNCTTVQAVVLLSPLHKKYGIKRVVVSTYQAVSGAGKEGILDLVEGLAKTSWQTSRIKDSLLDINHVMNPINLLSPRHHYDLKAFKDYIAGNVIPYIGDTDESGYTSEELKIINETKKIMGLPNLLVSATCVRVPVINGHSESINIELEKEFDIDDVKEVLGQSPGITLKDYPQPLYCGGYDNVFVGRIRKDTSSNGINLFCVADNIRKGAATNVVQILEILTNS